MLIHLKIKRSPRNKLSFTNRNCTQEDSCLLARPIHCKKNQSTTKVKKLLTERVSMHGNNFNSQPNLNYDSNQCNSKQKLEKDNKISSEHQLMDKKVKSKKKQKNMTLELSTLYKKSFKYNTTIHQIVKNFSKNNNCKIKHHLYNKNCKTEGISFNYDYEQDASKQYLKPFQKTVKQQKLTSSEKLQNLEKINDQYRMSFNNLEPSNRNKCHINQIQFEGKPRKMSVSSYQWKTSHAQLPFSKSNWIYNSKLKRKLKQNILIQSKYNLMIENSDNMGDLIAIQQNPQINSNQISVINGSNYQSLCKNSILQRENLQKNCNQILKTQEEGQHVVTGRESFRETVTKNRKKYSMDLRQTQHFQFSVDGWNTKQKQEYEPYPPMG